jgi:light-regulated signal transduction histidine kinase (bacteriophytochrome)
MSEQNRHYLKTITESVKLMGRLIDDLLAFSRMGRAAMIKTRVNMNEMVRAVGERFKVDCAGRDVTFDIADLPEAHCDPVLTRAVFENLVSNAIKYSGKRDKARIEIGSSSADGETVYFVRDNGSGFDMKYVDKLFGVFQRLHTADEFEGTGIGLANVRRIITRHGGRTWAEGVPDKGAVFYFSLPRT